MGSTSSLQPCATQTWTIPPRPLSPPPKFKLDHPQHNSHEIVRERQSCINAKPARRPLLSLTDNLIITNGGSVMDIIQSVGQIHLVLFGEWKQNRQELVQATFLQMSATFRTRNKTNEQDREHERRTRTNSEQTLSVRQQTDLAIFPAYACISD